ncbi:MAG: hypothetical protein WC459_03755 [Patescibacteria group bacterium]
MAAKNPEYEVFKALSFYDIFEYPLTLLEIHRNLEASCDMTEAALALETLKTKNKIAEESGFFFLSGRNGLAEKRKSRFLISFKKIKKARRAVAFFRLLPWIKFIGICNSLGNMNASNESDIDFFVITKKKRLWTARFFLAGALKIFGLRPGKITRDKMCLSFFAGEDGLDVSGAALPDGDPYFYRWISWIMPLYDDGIYQKFIESNAWVKNFLPNFKEQRTDAVHPNFKNTGLAFGNWLEARLKNFQLKIMPQELKEALLRSDRSVILGDAIIKLHALDRRMEYKKNYELRINNGEQD